MLVCFGISWQISIVKVLRTKQVVGKSPVLMTIICLGYLSGILQVLFAFDWVILLYFVNLCMVAFDIFLYFYYLPKEPSRGEYAAIPNCR